MKIFLSWSGEKSQEAAKVIADWLPYVMNSVSPWVSAKGIEAGTRWGVAIQNELAETNFGILLGTAGNLTSPWLLFEAGALAKTLDDTYVVPYLLDITPPDIPDGPLSQFQAVVADETGTLQLIKTINKAMKDEGIPENRLETAFLKWWPELKTKLANLPDEEQNGNTYPKRSTEEMTREILQVVRQIRASHDHQAFTIVQQGIVKRHAPGEPIPDRDLIELSLTPPIDVEFESDSDGAAQ